MVKKKTIAKKPKAKATVKIQEPFNSYNILIDLVDNIPDVIYFKDIEGRLVFVNKAHANGLGLDPEEVIGKTDYDIFPKEKADKMALDDQHVMKTGESIVDKIERATHPEGLDTFVSTTKIPRYDLDGKLIGLIGITRDVSKRVHQDRLNRERANIEKKIEVLEDLNRVKSEFISTVSHELRTPLAIIKQMLSLIFDETAGPLNDQQRELMVKVRNNIERLKRMLDELLDISMLEDKQLRLRYSLVNLNTLLEDSQAYFKELAAEKNIRLTYHLPKEEVSLFIDVERIIQVVTNLINNAIKFTEANGRIKIEVKILETKVRIAVIDTGIGIAEEDVPKVFSKFTQLSKHYMENTGGIGLGLAIVKDLVEKHGGEVWVESKVGLGSYFYFTLPRFYTGSILEKKVQNKINEYLDDEIPVCLINLLIVNYDDFKKKVKISLKKLSADLNEIITETFDSIKLEKKVKDTIYMTNLVQGKYAIIFPEAEEKRIVKFCELLRDRIKNYFIQKKVEDVFIAIGMLSYHDKKQLDEADINSDQGVNIKEIYVGSEMRRYKRIKYNASIEIVPSKGKAFKANTFDMSQVGMGLTSKKVLRADEDVEVNIQLIKKKINVTAMARVAWVKQLDRSADENVDMYKVGLEFIALNSKDRKLLFSELRLYYE